MPSGMGSQETVDERNRDDNVKEKERQLFHGVCSDYLCRPLP